MTVSPHWRPLEFDDLLRVEAIAAQVHPDLPERREVLAEKRALFPQGCFAFVCNGVMQGYALSHPWRLFEAPALNRWLGALPEDANCLFLHDVAVLPPARGHGALAMLMRHLHDVRQSLGLSVIACISVYGTDAMWTRHGFTTCQRFNIMEKISGYGPTARYMTCASTVVSPC